MLARILSVPAWLAGVSAIVKPGNNKRVAVGFAKSAATHLQAFCTADPSLAVTWLDVKFCAT